mmetsp:Transcript_773/g.965  ORF Transcript_773/g.965 Transcript_773/m.965 type:complete len:96 (+) Transcript_773:574-861(+)
MAQDKIVKEQKKVMVLHEGIRAKKYLKPPTRIISPTLNIGYNTTRTLNTGLNTARTKTVAKPIVSAKPVETKRWNNAPPAHSKKIALATATAPRK